MTFVNHEMDVLEKLLVEEGKKNEVKYYLIQVAIKYRNTYLTK